MSVTANVAIIHQSRVPHSCRSRLPRVCSSSSTVAYSPPPVADSLELREMARSSAFAPGSPSHDNKSFVSRETDATVMPEASSPGQQRKRNVHASRFSSLREEIAHFEQLDKAKTPWWVVLECSDEEEATCSGFQACRQEGSGEEACSCVPETPQQQGASQEADGKLKRKVRGTPLWEPIFGKDGKPFNPIERFFKVRMESGDLEVSMGKRSASVDLEPEARKVAKH